MTCKVYLAINLEITWVALLEMQRDLVSDFDLGFITGNSSKWGWRISFPMGCKREIFLMGKLARDNIFCVLGNDKNK
jgi:hypothetical protein